MKRDFCILIHTVRIQTTVSLYSSSPDSPGGYSLCDGWYICAAVLTPFFHFGRIEHDLLGVFFSSTNSKAIFWGTKTTNFYKNRSFWPQIQFFPRTFWVQFSAASGTPPSVFRPSTPPPGPDSYRKGESFYHVIIPSAQWSWRWVYWFHLVRPSVHLRIILHVILRIMAWMRRIGNAEIFSALSPRYGWNADIMRRFLRIPVRILPSAFSPHFFPYKNAEISPRSCPNTPIRISSAFFSAFFPI